MSSKKTTPAGRLLRKPRAPVSISEVASEDPCPSRVKSQTSNGSQSFYEYYEGSDRNLVSPPPPSQFDSRTNSALSKSHPSGKAAARGTVHSRPRNPRDDMVYVLDPNYREKTSLGTYVEGQSLVKPFKQRGPEGLPYRRPHLQNLHQPLVGIIVDRFDTEHYKPPEFTLQDFLLKISQREHVPLEKTQRIMFSKHNYKQLQKLLVEQCLHPPQQQHVATIDVQIPNEVKHVTPRIPQKQLLYEMAALVKEQMSQVCLFVCMEDLFI